MTDLLVLPSASNLTAIEQTRAVAEVMAAAQMAKSFPRRPTACRDAMVDACQRRQLADVAFYRYRRSDQSITGETIHLARELAMIWGNVAYGIHELRRDDEAGESEMLAWAWDLEGNTRDSHGFIVPHRRDTKQGVRVLTDMRDIYENNANNGARRVREAIFAVLPGWFRAEAAEMCRTTLEQGGGVPLVERISKCIGAFREIKVDQAALERKVGRRADDWSAYDLADLQVIHGSIKRGEVKVADEFPPAPASLEEVANARDQLVKRLVDALADAGITEAADQQRVASAIAGRVGTPLAGLTPAEIAGALAQVQATKATQHDRTGDVLRMIAEDNA